MPLLEGWGSYTSLSPSKLKTAGKIKVFFTLSGEHPTLPAAEVKALLEAEEVEVKEFEARRFLARMLISQDDCSRILDRASMVTGCYHELLACQAEVEEIAKEVGGVDWSTLKGKSFAVRVERKGGCCPHLRSAELERLIGKVVKTQVPEARVCLKAPEVLVKGLVVYQSFYLGLSLAEVRRGVFDERRPRRRPFFHPSALEPKLARLFVNLARAKRGDLLFDPFAGTGSILMEAALIGCSPVGLDIDLRMVEGTKANLRRYAPHAIGALRGDARHPPILKVDCVVTDPPYGRTSSTRGEDTSTLIENFLNVAADLLPHGRYMCLATPSWLDLAEAALKAGFKVVEEHEIRVHRSLTRRVTVFRRC
ncbi:MAG: hypothetical protein DRN06_06155 [Thermoprotei archaeon]|nr:MAG: hypothetical protein DRN06_06155 [Thermoprotei archaeon]